MTTLRQLAEAAKACCNKCGYFGTDEPTHAGCNYMASRSVVVNHAQFVALLDTIDAQRKLLERTKELIGCVSGRLERDITAHLEATK